MVYHHGNADIHSIVFHCFSADISINNHISKLLSIIIINGIIFFMTNDVDCAYSHFVVIYKLVVILKVWLSKVNCKLTYDNNDKSICNESNPTDGYHMSTYMSTHKDWLKNVLTDVWQSLSRWERPRHTTSTTLSGAVLKIATLCLWHGKATRWRKLLGSRCATLCVPVRGSSL